MTTTLYRLNDRPDAPFAFDHNDMCIVDPTVSLCSRFPAQPSEYGFTVQQDGDGHVWLRSFVLENGTPVTMMVNTDGGRMAVRVNDSGAWVAYRLDSSDDPLRMADVARHGAPF